MTTIKGKSIAAVSSLVGMALVVAFVYVPAGTAQADGMPGVADATVLYTDGYTSVLDVTAAPAIAGTEAIVFADGMPVAGMVLMPGSNPMPLPAAASYVVTGVGTGDIAWATAESWGELPGTD